MFDWHICHSFWNHLKKSYGKGCLISWFLLKFESKMIELFICILCFSFLFCICFTTLLLSMSITPCSQTSVKIFFFFTKTKHKFIFLADFHKLVLMLFHQAQHSFHKAQLPKMMHWSGRGHFRHRVVSIYLLHQLFSIQYL